MHIEVLIEDSSGHRLLDILLPQLLGRYGQTNTWRVVSYKGLGRIPKGLNATADPAKRILLDRMRQVLQGLPHAVEHRASTPWSSCSMLTSVTAKAS